ncbi:MAG: hypothetical protein L3J39_08260 [Verrucomicrobiales bacterium]|nr:hypothetical protein [Verrucomicrobiales bacterium]
MKMLKDMPSGGADFDPFFVPDDWARLQYGRMLWKSPSFRNRLLKHWTDIRHPYRDRFVNAYQGKVERLLSSAATENKALDETFRKEGESLRTVMREIPPVFGDFF